METQLELACRKVGKEENCCVKQKAGMGPCPVRFSHKEKSRCSDCDYKEIKERDVYGRHMVGNTTLHLAYPGFIAFPTSSTFDELVS